MKPWLYILCGFLLIIFASMILTGLADKTASNNELAGNLLFIVFISGATWGGCMLINRFLTRPFSKMQQKPMTKLVFSYLISGVYAIGLIILCFRLWEKADPEVQIPYSNYIRFSVFSLLITLLVTSIYAVSDYIRQWKRSELKAEQMKQQMLQSQYESLKNQVNPHFLFNSLNTLTALISEEPEKAIDFVQKLSRVFRYALQNQEKITIDLESEAEIVRSYLSLQKMRFGDNLLFEIDLPERADELHLVTQALLILAENAVKHNEASAENPLQVRIFTEGTDYVVLKNNLRRKKMTLPSTGIGLINIVSRYLIITEKEVMIIENENEFVVKIPLICP